MQNGLKTDGQMRALAIALGGAIATSVVAMFIPVSVFEAVTGSTGISELVPATGAPLGDTAKAVIAFGFGATAFALLSAYLLRKPAKAGSVKTSTSRPVTGSPDMVTTTTVAASAADSTQKPSFVDQMRAKLEAFMESRRKAKEEAVTDLSDLPKLRTGDAHPDAPPRRPISAHRDFGDIMDEPLAPAAVIEEVVVPAPETAPALEEPPVLPVADPVVQQSDALMAPSASFAPEPPLAPVAPSAGLDMDTVSAMVERLETALDQRKDQLARLEAIAAAELAGPVLAEEAQQTDMNVMQDMPAVRPVTLEAVPSAPAKKADADEMDAALRSALETLHRMNVRTR